MTSQKLFSSPLNKILLAPLIMPVGIFCCCAFKYYGHCDIIMTIVLNDELITTILSKKGKQQWNNLGTEFLKITFFLNIMKTNFYICDFKFKIILQFAKLISSITALTLSFFSASK